VSSGIPSCSSNRRQAAFALNFSGPSTRSQAKRTHRSLSSSGYSLGAGAIRLPVESGRATRPGTVQPAA
jgi:hypothetical protein